LDASLSSPSGRQNRNRDIWYAVVYWAPGDFMARLFKYKFKDGSEFEFGDLTSKALKMLEEVHGDCIYNGWAEFMGVGRPSTLGVIGGSNTRGDGFKTGYNPALGIEIKSPKHYRDELRVRGLQEVGNEKIGGTRKKEKLIDNESLKEMVEKKEISSEAANTVSNIVGDA
jgi:hypothetical protein